MHQPERLPENSPLKSAEEICPAPDFSKPGQTQPLSPSIHLASVYRCESPEQADYLLSTGPDGGGYVYSRDGHPNASLLSEKCRQLHAADKAMVCGSGMSALAAAALAHLQTGEHLLVANQLYGKTLQLLTGELSRLGITSDAVNACDLGAVAAAIRPQTKLLVVETISNPTLRVVDVAALAKICQKSNVLLLVDNTFASPALCRPIDLGADLVVESLTKVMSGHSDVLLGLICGKERHWSRIPVVLSSWGLSSHPFDCWLAARGLATLGLRVERCSSNALRAAEFLEADPRVKCVYYPGLASHPDHALAARQLAGHFGSMVTFTLGGGISAAKSFISAAKKIPFCPSLGDVSTSLSHPLSTSHRALSEEARRRDGIDGGTIRLSLGIEPAESIVDALREGLAAVEPPQP